MVWWNNEIRNVENTIIDSTLGAQKRVVIEGIAKANAWDIRCVKAYELFCGASHLLHSSSSFI